MSWVAVAIGGAGLIMGYVGSQRNASAQEQQAGLERAAGARRKQAAEFEAGVLETQAGQTVAAAERDAIDVQRLGKLAESRTVALAAASGGGATSPTVVGLVGKLARESSYNAARALYAGEEKARLMKLQAFTLRQQGEFAQLTGDLSGKAAETRARGYEYGAYGSLLAGGGGLYAKYGGGGPSGTTPLIEGQVPGQFSTINPQYG